MLSGICRLCGCTSGNACEGGCCWVDEAETLCSACVPKLTDEELLAMVQVEVEAAEEVCAEAGGMIVPPVLIEASAWLAIVGALQFARTHPEFPANTAAIVDQFAAGIGSALSDCGPAMAEIIRRGWRDKPPQAMPGMELVLPEELG